MMTDDDLVELLGRWQAIKREAMDGSEALNEMITAGAGYLVRASGLDEAHVVALQELIEPQLRMLLRDAIRQSEPPWFTTVITEEQLDAIGETATAYYVEALMFGYWAR
jgi:hypothetical protein